MADSPIPTDAFSIGLRRVHNDPGALRASSTLHSADLYGNTETWVLETFRLDRGEEVVFLQRSSADEPLRLVLPADVTRALARHRDQLQAAARRRSGHKLVALRKQRGDKLGNPEALRAGRRKAVRP